MFFYSCLSLLTFLRMHVGVKLLPKGGANYNGIHTHKDTFSHTQDLALLHFNGMLNGKDAGCF